MRTTFAAFFILISVLCCASAARAHAGVRDQPRFDPSFPCPSPRDPLAQLICSSPELSEADLRYIQAYYALRGQTGPGSHNALRDEAIAFTRSVRAECGVPEVGSSRMPGADAILCVERRYDEQRRDLISRLTGAAAQEAARPLRDHLGLQADLQTLGFLPPDAAIDGVYGTGTRAAIQTWQRVHGRPVTGLLSDADAKALAAQVRAPASRQPAPSGQPAQTAAPQPSRVEPWEADKPLEQWIHNCIEDGLTLRSGPHYSPAPTRVTATIGCTLRSSATPYWAYGPDETKPLYTRDYALLCSSRNDLDITERDIAAHRISDVEPSEGCMTATAGLSVTKVVADGLRWRVAVTFKPGQAHSVWWTNVAFLRN